jgi:hypothetical protein
MASRLGSLEPWKVEVAPEHTPCHHVKSADPLYAPSSAMYAAGDSLGLMTRSQFPTPSHAGSTPNAELNLPGSSGEWVSTVQQIVPFLNKKGVQRALQILDYALAYMGQVRDVDSAMRLIPMDSPASWAPADEHAMMKFLHLKANAREKQKQLLRELRMLSVTSALPQGRASLSKLGELSAITEGVNALQLDVQDLRRGGAGGYPSANTVSSGWLDPSVLAPSEPAESRLAPKFQDKGPQEDFTTDADKQAAQETRTGRTKTLSSNLQMLSREDPACLLIVRRIHKLGFKATRALKLHFSQYGVVVRLLLAHSTHTDRGDYERQARRRPSSLGFVQMSTVEAAEKIIALGTEHIVDGIPILVQKFERQVANDPGVDVDADGLTDGMGELTGNETCSTHASCIDAAGRGASSSDSSGNHSS